MLLNVSLIFAAALSLVSCFNIGHMVQNARKEGIYAMKIVEKESGDTMKTIDKEGEHTLRIIDKTTGDTMKTIDKEGEHTLSIIDKAAGDTMKTIDKEGEHTLSIIDKAAVDTMKTIDKEGEHTLSIIDKAAGDTMKTIDKEGEHTLSIINKAAANSLKSAEDVFMLLKKVSSNSTCACFNYTCGCCLQIVVEKISLNETGCLNISYLPDEYGFEFLFTLNGLVIIDEKISVKNPPPVCAAIPYIHQLASLCIRFYNLDYKAKQFSGCADVEIEVEGVVVKKYDLGCIHIPPSQKHFLTKVISQ